MVTLRGLLAICLVATLAGCASMPEEMALDSTVHSEANAGLVIGALIEGGPYGTWLEFRDIKTGKTYGWGAKNYYSAWLPAGEYEVSSLGSRRGVMGPYQKPLRFAVTQGQINYLGELVYGCPSSSRPDAVYGVKNCGFLALGACSVPSPNVSICIVDRQEQAVRSFLRKNPERADMPVRASLMGR